MRPGLGSFAFTWAIGVTGQVPEHPMTPLLFLEEARRLGVNLVQICDNLPLIRLSDAELEEFQRVAGAAGIRIELGTRGISEPNLRAHLALAVRLGSPILRVVLDHDGDEPSPREAVDRVRVVLPAFVGARVKLAIENHDRFTSRTLAAMIQDLGSDHVGVCLDTVNSFGALEGPSVVVPALAPHTLSLHVKDFTIRRPPHHMGFVIEGCAAGEGRLDLGWLRDQMRAAPAPGPSAILETWVTPAPTLAETLDRERAWTRRGLEALKACLGS